MSALPCPFCGSANVSTTEASTFRWWVAVCNDCGAKAPEVRRQTLGEGTKKQWEEAARVAAVAQWNKRASAWQPIETAPKDGTSVLLCWARNADGEPIDWRKDPSTAQVFVQVAAWWETEWVVYCSLISEPRLHFTPTHWQPLPEPPEAA